MNRVVEVEAEETGEVYTINCDDSDPEVVTYAQLKNTLRGKGCTLIKNVHQLVTMDDGVCGDDNEIDFNTDKFIVRIAKFNITVIDDGKVTMMSIEADATVDDLRNQYEQEEGITLRHLSLGGIPLDDNEKRLMSYDAWKDECTVLGQIRVVVHDKLLAMESEISLYEFDDVFKLLQRYKEDTKRTFTEEAYLQYKDEKLERTSKLSSYDITHDTVLEFTNPPFTVTIREKGDAAGSGIELTVDDSFTVKKLKAEYSREAEEGLLAEDKLIFDNQELDEEEKIFKYQITEGSKLYAEKEDMRALEFKYTCAECGEDVKLKKEDAVICRDCESRCVYKSRTTRVCQYLAR